jgi:5-methylcytosine-specific restriction enzyme subunit McrC
MSSGPIRIIRTGEHQRFDLETALVGPADRLRLERLAGRRLLALDEVGSRLRIAVNAAAGVIVLDAYRIVVEPKLAFDGTRLVQWMCFACKTNPPTDDLRRRWDSAETGFFDLIVRALVDECRRLERTGIRRDYRRRESVEPVLRGRMDFGRQIAQRYGQVDRLHVRAFARETAVWENQACHAALRKAARLAIDPDLACEASELAKAFPSSANLRATVAVLRRARYTRVNQRYRPAHAWARMVLDDNGIGDFLVESGAAADAFVVDMNRLWEAIVQRMVADAIAPLGGALVPIAGADRIRMLGDLGSVSSYPPDALIGFPATPRRIPVDAKYKQYAARGIQAPDVHQLAIYAQAYAVDADPFTLLVFPEPGRASRRDLTLTGPAGNLARITVLGIDTELEPAAATGPVQAALAESAPPRLCGTMDPAVF